MDKDKLISEIEILLNYIKKPDSQEFRAKDMLDSILANWYEDKE